MKHLKQMKLGVKKSQWFCWHLRDVTDERIKMIRAIIMFTCLLLTYALFQFSWQVVNQANSTGNGPVSNLYPEANADPTITRVSNWAISLTRGCTAVFLGIFINRIGHKKAVIFGFSMFLISFPYTLTVFMRTSMGGNLAAGQAAYALFIIFRCFLAVGGTVILITAAPVIAVFFSGNMKTRNLAAKGQMAPAQFAGVIASLIFVDSATSFNIGGDWELIGGIAIALAAVFFIIYLIFGIHFNIKTVGQAKPQTQIQEGKTGNPSEDGLKSVLKQPKVWILLTGGMFMMYAGIEPASGVLSNLWFRGATNNLNVWNSLGIYNVTSSLSTYQFIWNILYSLALFVGLVTIARWTNTKYSAGKYGGINVIIGVVFWAISFYLGTYSLTNAASVTFCILFGLIGATFIFGTQLLLGVFPFRWRYTPRQISSYTSFSWTWMYIGYTVLDIITGYVGNAGITSNVAIYSDLLVIDPSLLSNQNIFCIYDAAGNAIYSYDALNVLSKALLGSTGNGTYTWNNVLENETVRNLLSTKYGVNNLATTMAGSRDHLQYQYIPQICLIGILPAVSAIGLGLQKLAPGEIKFTFKHFKEHHMHFNKSRELINKVFGTNIPLKKVDNEII